MATNKKVKASQIAKFLGATMYGKDVVINKPVLITEIAPNCVSFIRGKDIDEQLLNNINKTTSCLIICNQYFKNKLNVPVIVSELPYHEFSSVVGKFFAKPKAKIIMGKNCHIKQNAVIGGEGFNYQKNKKGINERVTHIGGVTLGDNVDIGSGSTIDRGVIGNTVLDSNVKIDNLVHIGHDCKIGDGTLIAAGAILGGRVVVGKNCFVGLNSCIRQRITIGDNAVIGMGAVVVKDVPSDTIVIGNPAKPFKNK